MKVRVTEPTFIPESFVDGTGIRLYVGLNGCKHNCFGCFQHKDIRDLDKGKFMDIEEIKAVILANSMKGTDGITLSGGDSLLQPEAVYEISKYTKGLGLSVWLYTGYVWEDIIQDEAKFNALEYVDILVDGKFILAEKNLSLAFRGSRNQRIIDVKASKNEGYPVVLNYDRKMAI